MAGLATQGQALVGLRLGGAAASVQTQLAWLGLQVIVGVVRGGLVSAGSGGR